jgi:hypothetical protein
VDIDFPYFQLREGTALLMLFEFGDPDQSPLDILNNGYIPTLGEDRKIIETPKSIQVNDLPAATTKYTSPQPEGNAIEKITIIIDQGKSIGFLSIALEKEYDQFEPQFSEMINSLTIYPDTPSPNVQELKQGALDNYLLYEDRGYSFYYPSEWEVDAIDQDLLMIKPPGVESVFGPVYIIPPDSMETWVELSGVKLEGQKVELVPILYEMLWAYGFMVVHDVQVVSSPEQKRNGNQDFLTVIVGATDNDKEIPISGIFSVVKGKDQVLGLFTWMYDLEKNIHRVETIISSIQIE